MPSTRTYPKIPKIILSKTASVSLSFLVNVEVLAPYFKICLVKKNSFNKI